MTEVYVGFESHTDYSDYDSTDDWDRPNTSLYVSNWFAKVAHKDTGNPYGYYHSTFEVEDVNAGDTVHIVYVEYDTGDTFGRDSGQVIILDVFRDFTKAQDLVNRIYGDSKSNREFSFDNDGNYIEVNGKSYYTGTWKGYFESFTSCNIETVMVRY